MADAPTSLECSVCLESLDTNTKTFFELEACRHSFHYKCIRNWMNRYGKCPYCRTVVAGNDRQKLMLNKPSRIAKYRETLFWFAPYLESSGWAHLGGMLQVAELFYPLETEVCISPIKSALNRVGVDSSVDEFYNRAVRSEPDSVTELDDAIDQLARLVSSTLDRVRRDFGLKLYCFLFDWMNSIYIYQRLHMAIVLLEMGTAESLLPVRRYSLAEEIDVSMRTLKSASPEQYAFLIEWLDPRNDRLQLVWNKFRAKERNTSDEIIEVD